MVLSAATFWGGMALQSTVPHVPAYPTQAEKEIPQIHCGKPITTCEFKAVL